MQSKWFENIFHKKKVPTVYFTRSTNADKYLITNDGDIIDIFDNYKKSGLIACKIIVPTGTTKAQALNIYQMEIGRLERSAAFDELTKRNP